MGKGIGYIMSMDEKLKSCPFCGGKAKLAKIEITNRGGYLNWVACELCGTSPHGHYKETEPAIAAWNTRSTDKIIASIEEEIASCECYGLPTGYYRGRLDFAKKMLDILNNKE